MPAIVERSDSLLDHGTCTDGSKPPLDMPAAPVGTLTVSMADASIKPPLVSAYFIPNETSLKPDFVCSPVTVSQ